LDRHSGIYVIDQVESVVSPHQQELLELYYLYVHPTLPILEPRSTFQAALVSNKVPASLLAAIYCAAASFWTLSEKLRNAQPFDQLPLRDFISAALSLETRTPNIRTVQAMLIFLQLPPVVIREPNHPGYWALTAQVR
jgi:hypothetical protein